MDTKEFCSQQYLDWLQEAKNQRNFFGGKNTICPALSKKTVLLLGR